MDVIMGSSEAIRHYSSIARAAPSRAETSGGTEWAPSATRPQNPLDLADAVRAAHSQGVSDGTDFMSASDAVRQSASIGAALASSRSSVSGGADGGRLSQF